MGVEGDAEPQFGHPVLLEQFQVRAKRQAEGTGDPLREPAVLGRVTQTALWIGVSLEKEYLKIRV